MKDETMTVKNIKAIYYQATANEIIEGKDWYRKAYRTCCLIADTYNLDLTTVVAVVAALSPRLAWGRNIMLAEKMISLYTQGLDPMAVGGCLSSSRIKACRILSGENINTVLSGYKVVSFYNNLLLSHEHVTVDTHAISIVYGERIGEKTASSIFRSEKKYNAMAELYKQVSRELGLLPYELQAITWVTWRRIHFIDKKYGK